MDDNQRLIEVCERLVKEGLAKSLSAISKKCGKTAQYFTDLKNGKAKYSREFLDILIKEYPVNKDYILTGKGESIILEEMPIQKMKKESSNLSSDEEKTILIQSIGKMTETADRNSKTLEKIVDYLISHGLPTNNEVEEKGAEYVESKDNNDAAHSA